MYITSSTWRMDYVRGLGRNIHYLKYMESRLVGGEWGKWYITSSAWRLNYVEGLGSNIHYLKYLESILGGGIGENCILPQVPGDSTM